MRYIVSSFPAVVPQRWRRTATRALLLGATIQLLPQPGHAQGDTVVLDPITLTVSPAAGDEDSASGPVAGIAASLSATGTKSDTPVLETTQSVSVVGRREMDMREVDTVSEALSYTAGVVAGLTYDPKNDDVTIRGFAADHSFYLDGVRASPGMPYLPIEPYGLERVEVLKGPASVLYGSGEPGGIVSQISKRPTATAFGQLQLETGDPRRALGAIDLGGPLGPGRAFSWRLTGLYHDADNQVRLSNGKRLYLAPALTWSPSDDTSVTFFLQHQRDKVAGYNGFLPPDGTLYPNPNGRIRPEDGFIGEPGLDYWNTTRTKLGYALEHRLGGRWVLRQNLAYTRSDSEQFISYPGALLPDMRTLERSLYGEKNDFDGLAIDTRIEGGFDTGPVSHALLIGVDHMWYDGTVLAYGGDLGPIDIFDPVYGQTPIAYEKTQDLTSHARQTGIYVQDQARWDRWILNLTARYDKARQRRSGTFYGGFLDERADDSALTWRAGAGRLFDNDLMAYVSYATSFSPEIGIDRDGNLFKPSRGRQLEIGVKYAPAERDAMLTLSVFDLRKTNVTTPDPGDPFNFDVQTGEIRVRGLEAEAKVSPIAGLDLIASYTFNDAQITRNNPDPYAEGNPTYIGNRPVDVAEHQLSAWADYTIQRGVFEDLTIGGGIRYAGPHFGDQANSVRIPGVTLFDAALRYDFRHVDPRYEGLALAVNATNLFNRTYVSGCSETFACYYGNKRMVTATLTYDW